MPIGGIIALRKDRSSTVIPIEVAWTFRKGSSMISAEKSKVVRYSFGYCFLGEFNETFFRFT